MADDLPGVTISELKKIVKSFRNIYEPAADVVSARVFKAPNQINNIIISQWHQRNVDRETLMKIIRYQLTDLDFNSCIDIDTVDVSHWILNASSKSNKFRAVICTTSENYPNDKYKNYLEIWSEGKSIATFDLTALNLHEAVYADYPFSSLSWSDQEDNVIYIAEKRKPKTSRFCDQKTADELSKSSTNVAIGEEHVYKESWGEGLSSKHQSVIVSCDVVKKTLSVLKGIPKHISPGQTIHAPDGTGVVGVGYMNIPRRFGLIYCTNRRSHIFYLTREGDYVMISEEQYSAHSPKFSPDGKYLVWFQRQRSGPTQMAHALIKCEWSTKDTCTVIRTIPDRVFIENGKEFFGIYTSLSFNGNYVFSCWTADSKYLLFSTDQKFRTSTYAVNIETGKIWDIGYEDQEKSTILLDVSNEDYALVKVTSFKQSPVLASIHIPSLLENNPDKSLFSFLTQPATVYDNNIISNFVVPIEHKEYGCCYATYYGPQSNQPETIPLIMYLHGGPHVTVANTFMPKFNYFIDSGFGILIVFFHGTSGFGQIYIDSIIGRLGSLDVEDCYNTLKSALVNFPWLDPDQVVLFGGSSGGFLMPHLVSRYPNDFKGSVMRNPVVDIYLRSFLTDIPDWATVELGFPYKGMEDIINNYELYNKMMEVSPMKNVKNTKAPTLLLMGAKDLRVPPLIGLAYYHTLRELNVPAKALLYDDGHRFAKVPTEIDSIIHSVIWFKRCLKKVNKKSPPAKKENESVLESFPIVS